VKRTATPVTSAATDAMLALHLEAWKWNHQEKKALLIVRSANVREEISGEELQFYHELHPAISSMLV
jgi:hypothetical protein